MIVTVVGAIIIIQYQEQCNYVPCWLWQHPWWIERKLLKLVKLVKTNCLKHYTLWIQRFLSCSCVNKTMKCFLLDNFNGIRREPSIISSQLVWIVITLSKNCLCWIATWLSVFDMGLDHWSLRSQLVNGNVPRKALFIDKLKSSLLLRWSALISQMENNIIDSSYFSMFCQRVAIFIFFFLFAGSSCKYLVLYM